MHILYLHQYFVPPDGSGGTRSYEMARRLVRAGHRVTLVTSSAFFPKHYKFEEGITALALDGIKLRVLSIPYSNKMAFNERVKVFLRFSFRALIEIGKVESIDVVFASSTPLTIVLPGIAAKILHQCPMVFEVRDLWPEVPIAMGVLKDPIAKFAARFMEKLAYRASKRIVALSPGMADEVRLTGIPKEIISVIPNCCDVDLFRIDESHGEAFLKKYPFLKGGALVAYTGTIGTVNGVCYLAEIASEMVKLDPECKFVVAGDGRERDLLQKKAYELGVLGANFWIIPPLPKCELPGMLAVTTIASSLVINLPNLWHNSANKVFDGFAAGCPIMINHEGWLANFLRESGAGIVVPPEDPKAAAIIIHKFLSDAGQLENARKAVQQAADITFNRDRLAKCLINVIEGAVSGPIH